MNKKGIIFAWAVFCSVVIFCLGYASLGYAADFGQLSKGGKITAYPIRTGKIRVYKTSAREARKATVRGKDLVVTITSQEEDSFYGKYALNGKKYSGWFAKSVFVADPSYEKKDAMVRYTTDVCGRPKGEPLWQIPAYAGMDVVGQSGEWYQVVYRYRKNAYRLCWMAEKDYEDSARIYDGTEKRIMAEGTYRVRPKSDLSKAMTAKGTSVTLSKSKDSSAQQFRFEFLGGNCYRIVAPGTDLCLAAEDPADDWEDPAEETTAEETEEESTEEASEPSTEETEEETETPDDPALVWRIVLAEKSETNQKSQSWKLTRTGAYYYLQNQKTGLYLNAGKVFTMEEKSSVAGKKFRISMIPAKNANWQIFCQYDPKWGGKNYGKTNTIAASACGIFSMVNALYALNGQFFNPMTLADYAVKHKYRVEGHGTKYQLFEAAAKKFGPVYGYKYVGKTLNQVTLANHLKNKGTAIAYVPGHYMALGDYKDGKYLALDSYAMAKRKTSPFGTWVTAYQLRTGALKSKNYFLFEAIK